MAKVRIYEVAKELGLENKQVLEICERLGISGKTSHSNSLTDDEADQIRRSVIRQAVSEGKKVGTETDIKGGTMTERRIGRNIVRRRKKSDEEQAKAQAEADAEASRIDFEEDARGYRAESEAREAGKPSEEQARADALKEANALFSEKSAPAGEAAAPSQEVEVKEEEVAAEEIPAEASAEETPAAEPAAQAAPAEEPKEERLDQIRKKHDVRAPKVLGKIDLPVEEEPTLAEQPAESAPTRQNRREKDLDLPPEEAPRGSSRRKRTRKQVLKKDELLDYEGERDVWRPKKSKHKKQKSEKPKDPSEQETASVSVVKINNEVTVGEFAKEMGIKAPEVIKSLMSLGVMATVNQTIDFDTATIVAEQYGIKVQNVGYDEVEAIQELKKEDDQAKLELRPPVVTVMGHVDHGKTSLLDRIRKASVADAEAGGITQHIGAYTVEVPDVGTVTFVDTPGHEAFTAMRGRGAQVTDVVVLVVAADDGVMPQTVEAINHARAAEVPIIVAINKMDKEGANPEKVKTQLSERELIAEDWGGDTIMIPVSAHTGEGIDTLLENLVLQAQILELKANPNRPGYGVVIESRLDRGRGPVMTVLVKNGKLKKQDIFLAGAVTGRVRALVSHDGKQLEQAGPGVPVEVLGAAATATAGDEFFVFKSEAEAKQVAEIRAQRNRKAELAEKGGVTHDAPLTLESFSEMVEQGDLKDLPIVVKADVDGSLEAVKAALQRLSNDEVRIRIIHSGVGGVTENDVQLAAASNAIVVGFNVRYDSRAQETAESTGVDVRFSRVIYELVESIQKAVTGMLAPEFREKTLGRVEVRQTFKVPKLGTIAGSYVIDGVVERGAKLRLLRDNRVVYEGNMASLRRFKDDVKEVKTGYECGIGIEGYQDIQDGDIIEVFKIEEVQPGTPA